MMRLWTEGEPLAIGPIAVGDDERFAFTLATPFTLEVTAESEAAELAWGVLVRGAAAGGRAADRRRRRSPSDAPAEPVAIATADRWVEQRVALAQRRRTPARSPADRRERAPTAAPRAGVAREPRVRSRRGRRGAARRRARARARRAKRRRSGRCFAIPTLGVVVYENTNALPRAFRVQRVEPTASEDAALTRLGDGFDFRTHGARGARRRSRR